MKRIVILAVVMTALTAKTFAGTFCDTLTSGLNPTYWSIVQSNYCGVQSQTGIYSVNATGDGVTIAKIAPTPGGIPYAGVNLNLAALGGSISGDFSAQIQFANAVIGPGNDQVQLNLYFADGSCFCDVDEPNGICDFYGGTNSSGPCEYTGDTTWSGQPGATAGTFVISRTGSTLTGSFDGTTIVSTSDGSPLTDVTLTLQNNSGSDDYPSVTFYNFSLTAVLGLIPPTIINAPEFMNGGFQVTFTGPSNQTYQVVSSTNLTLNMTNWLPVGSGTFEGGPVTYTNPAPTNAQQYYRIESP